MRYPLSNLRSFLALVALVGFAALSASCSSDRSTSSTATSSGTLRVAMLPKLVGISYFDATQRGADEAAQELKINLLYDGPTEARADDQARMIHGWVAQGVDVIAVAPNDPEAVSSALRGARDANVQVITWDTDANAKNSGRQWFVNQAPNEAIARALVDVMLDGLRRADRPLAGKYLIVSGTATASNQNTWMELMRKLLADEHPEMELLPHLTPGEDQRNAQEQTAESLAAHAQLRGIWGITSVALPAAARATRDAGRTKDVYVTGLSLPSLMREYIEDGTVEKFVLWDAVDLGYLTVQVAHRLQQGPLTAGRHDFGRLKDILVRDDQVILGAPVVFDRENLDRYQF